MPAIPETLMTARVNGFLAVIYEILANFQPLKPLAFFRKLLTLV